MANTLRFKRGLASGIPTALAGEPLFTTDTFDLYIGNGTTNTRFQKYIASGATTQILRGDGSLYTFPLAISSPSNGQVLKYNGTSWVNDSDSGITGSLTTNYLPKATGATTLGNSLVYDNGTNVGISQTTLFVKMSIADSLSATSVGSNYNPGIINIQNTNTTNNNLSLIGFQDASAFINLAAIGSINEVHSSSPNSVKGSLVFYTKSTGTPYISEAMRVTALQNLHIGTFSSDSGEKLQVTGTMKVTGASSFGAAMTVSAGNISLPYEVARVILGTQSASGDVHVGASGVGSPSVGNQDYGYYIAQNAYRQSNGAWKHSRTSTIPAVRHLGSGGVSSGTVGFYWDYSANVGTADITWTNLMHLTTSGNLGLGVTPSAWASDWKAIQVSSFAAFGGDSSDKTTAVSNNYYNDGSAKYIGTGQASLYSQYQGNHRFFVAGSGSAGGTITFTQAMTLTAAGRLILGAGDSGERLQVTGTAKITGATTFGDNVNLNGGVITFGGGVSNSPYTNSSWIRGASGAGTFITNNGITAWLGLKSNGDLDYNGGFTILASTGAATFSSSVTAKGTLTIGDAGVTNAIINSADGMYFNIDSDASGSTPEFMFGKARSGAGAGGTTFMTITNAGNVGIGTVSPSNKFDIQSANGTTYTSTPQLRVGGGAVNNNRAAILFSDNALSDGRISYYPAAAAASRFFSISARETESDFIINGSGYVGINNSSPAYGLDLSGSARISDAIAIGTTPDTNNPFKILKNINATVGIKFENTNTSSLAFSAVQLGTDVSGGTKFTNLVYASSGISASGVYNPDGTSLINNGNGGLNFLGNPIRMYTGGSNGVLRWDLVNDGYITHYSATAPTTSAADSYRQYSADVTAGNAAPHFRTENGAVIKLYQETTAVGNSIISLGGGNSVLDDTTFDGYTLRQIVKALRNQGILA